MKLCTVKAGHLHEVTQRGFGRVALPVRVGGETDRRVEAEIGAYIAGSVTLRVERQPDLQPLEGVQKHGAERAEREQRAGVAGPVLFFVFVNPADPVDQTLDGPENGTQEVLSALDDGRDKGSERLHARQDQEKENRDL